uniref:Sushi domain-containing protein n=1 Tax=Pygocentrus nattereri TaxID=42514 RepID=A0A3B4BS13_PYGNA
GKLNKKLWIFITYLKKIICDIPFGQHVSYPDYYFGGDRKLGVKKSFRCESGYHAAAGTATCTENGWIPNPLCTGKSLSVGGNCGQPPQIEDAVQDFKDRYEDGEKADYACPAFYIKEGDLTCTRGRWTGSGKCWRPCTVDLKAMDDRKLQLTHKDTEKIYLTHEDVIEFSCKRGYRRAKDSVPFRQRCTNGHIDLPVCV